jgi:hypothetical protein
MVWVSILTGTGEFLYSKTIYTSSGAHPGSYPVGIVVLPWD